MTLPMYDLEGVLCGHHEYKGARTLKQAVLGDGNCWGYRMFTFNAPAEWRQAGPVVWEGVRCRVCHRLDSDPVHHGQDQECEE